MMKIFMLSVIIFLMLIIPGFSKAIEESDIDQGYTALNESYQARRAGNQELAREKFADALDFFRDNAIDRGPRLVRPETEYLIDGNSKNISLIENKTLFKIEFKVAPSSQSWDSKDKDDVIHRQQMILQKLILLSRENTELKESISRVEDNTSEIGNIGDTVSDIQDDTSGIAELENRLDDIETATEDTLDAVEQEADGADIADNIEDVANDVADIKDDMDILKDILNIVEDIKGDTGGIQDVGDKVDDVRDAVEE